MLNQTLGDDLRHDLVRVVNALAALEAQRKGEGRGEVLGIGGVNFSSASGIGER
jgi:hypothetical protein